MKYEDKIVYPIKDRNLFWKFVCKVLNFLLNRKEQKEFVELIKTKFVDKNGEVKFWKWIRRKNNSYAVHIAAIIDDKLVVTKEYRHPIHDYEYSLPAGLVEENESIEDAVKRELWEETGLEVEEITKISPFLNSSAGLTNESSVVVFVKAKGTISNANLEASEDIETILMSTDEVRELLKKADNKDVKVSSKGWFVLLLFYGEDYD